MRIRARPLALVHADNDHSWNPFLDWFSASLLPHKPFGKLSNLLLASSTDLQICFLVCVDDDEPC